MADQDNLPTFHLFSQLPSELRLKIWQLAVEEPRTVRIYYRKESYGSRVVLAPGAWFSPDAVPPVMHTCHDSREEGLKSYKPAFGASFREGRIYFDFTKDILDFSSPRGPEAHLDKFAKNFVLHIFLAGNPHGADDAEKIRYMNVEVDEEVYGRRGFLWNEIRECTGLKKLVLVVEETDDMMMDLMAVYYKTLHRVMVRHPDWKPPVVTVRSSVSGTCWGTVSHITPGPALVA